MRAQWPESTVTAREWLSACRERGPSFADEELDQIEALKRSDKPPEDKWAKR